MAYEELINEIRKLRKDIKDRARYEKYCRLKEQGKLSLKPAMGRGMPTVPEYHEWDGLSSRESEEQARWYSKYDRR